jgi:uncharacterized protein YecE (DUF72 family)
MKKNNIHIGCSSYNTTSWQPLFYPEGLPRTKWFDYYCQHFSTYEINATFYRFPTLKSLQSWHAKVPEGFLFSVKAPKTITHIKRLENCSEEISKFYAVCREGLQEKLGCILFQLPPSFSYTEERLQLVLAAMDNHFNNVVEFRHESWWRDYVYAQFAKHNITFCSVNYPKLPTTLVQTSPILYIRMHGSPKLFYSQYSTTEITSLYKEVISHDYKEAYIYFNNTASTAAIINAQQLKQLAGL